jgi:hypothetical protein
MVEMVEPDLAHDKEVNRHATTSAEELAARLGAHMVDFFDYRSDLPRVARPTRHSLVNSSGRPRPVPPRCSWGGGRMWP